MKGITLKEGDNVSWAKLKENINKVNKENKTNKKVIIKLTSKTKNLVLFYFDSIDDKNQSLEATYITITLSKCEMYVWEGKPSAFQYKCLHATLIRMGERYTFNSCEIDTKFLQMLHQEDQ